jgi:hypothetical protein
LPKIAELKDKDLRGNERRRGLKKDRWNALKMDESTAVIQRSGRGPQRNQQSYLPGNRHAGYLERWSLITSTGLAAVLTGW